MQLILDGRFRSDHTSARRLVIVDGKEVWLPQKDYRQLCKLVPPRRWVLESEFVDDWRERAAAQIYRLRRFVACPILNNKRGAYMLDVAPESVTRRS